MNTGAGNLYPVTIQIQNAFGGWTNVTCYSDTGNEISIFKREIADQLGLKLQEGQDFNVAGINGGARQFKKFKRWVKIGNLNPFQITIGFATKHGDLMDNLLGNKDLLKSGKFQVTYDHNTVTFTQKAMVAKIATTGANHMQEQETLNNLYDQLTTRRRRYEHEVKHNHKTDNDDGYQNEEFNSIGAYGVDW
jgi:hypothetical protein